VNPRVLGQHKPKEAAELWAGQLISGRYAQEHDTQPGVVNHLFMEGVTWIPERYLNQPDFWKRGVLPHHNEIAVDEEEHAGHLLYPKAADYARQFQMRRDLAIEHIQTAFREAVSGLPG
jgi:hypothetical protein